MKALNYNALDFLAEVGASGLLTPEAMGTIRDALLHAADGLEGDDTRTVRFRIGSPVRTSKANAFHWGALLPAVSLAYLDAGEMMPPDALHIWFKGTLLEACVAEWAQMSGETCEAVQVYRMPDGTTVKTLTTTALTQGAFGLYCARIMSETAVKLGADFSELAQSLRIDPPRSGRIDEPDRLRLVQYDADAAEIVDEDTGEITEAPPVRTMADLFDTTPLGLYPEGT